MLEEYYYILTRYIRSSLPESRAISIAIVSICSIFFFFGSIPTFSDIYPHLSSIAPLVLNIFPIPSFSPYTASPSLVSRSFLFSSLWGASFPLSGSYNTSSISLIRT
jgi:hypothetical protein